MNNKKNDKFRKKNWMIACLIIFIILSIYIISFIKIGGQILGNNKNKFTAFSVIFIIIGMISLSYAAVPLYDLFCRTTGFGGTPVAKKDNINNTNINSIDIKDQYRN